jgi:GTP pyrophosphokinase
VDQDRLYVFTPDGHVVDLPRTATPLDFAYRIHTDVGHHCRGAKVNNRIVPLNYQLNNADQVEILTGKREAPSRDWLNPALGYVNTARARAKIQHWFKMQANAWRCSTWILRASQKNSNSIRSTICTQP